MEIRILLSLLVIVVCVHGAECVKVFGYLDQLSPEEQQRAKELRPTFEKIDKYLETVEAGNSETLIKGIKAIYRKKMRNPMETLKPKTRHAMRLFMSLSESLRSCGHKSYKALALNHLAMDADRYPLNSPRKSLQVLRECALKHALNCRQNYEKNYTQLMAKIDRDAFASFSAVQKLFESDLKPEDECITNPLGYREAEPRLAKKCMKQLAERLLVASEGYLVEQMNLDYMLALERKLNTMIDNHMVKPCQVYQRYTADVFAPLIYDLSLEDAGQKDLLYPRSGSLAQGLRSFRACHYVLKNLADIRRSLVGEISDMFENTATKHK